MKYLKPKYLGLFLPVCIGFGLFGVAIKKSVFGGTEHGFAIELGGGLDYENNHCSPVRVVDVTAPITHIGAETHVGSHVVWFLPWTQGLSSTLRSLVCVRVDLVVILSLHYRH